MAQYTTHPASPRATTNPESKSASIRAIIPRCARGNHRSATRTAKTNCPAANAATPKNQNTSLGSGNGPGPSNKITIPSMKSNAAQANASVARTIGAQRMCRVVCTARVYLKATQRAELPANNSLSSKARCSANGQCHYEALLGEQHERLDYSEPVSVDTLV